jgi:hypothetical protein
MNLQHLDLLKRDPTPSDVADILTKIRDGAFERSRIRCPQCEWQPLPSSLWTCVDVPFPEAFHAGCGRSWNTFETFGACPGCAHQWHWTACLSCARWSLHEDWYEDEPGDSCT